VAICVSGSALVFRNEMFAQFSTGPVVVGVTGPRLADQQLREIAERAYPDYQVSDIWEPRQPDHAVELWLTRGDSRIEQLFNPYTGEDLGPAEPAMVRFLTWLAFFHDDLLDAESGRTINGIGGLLLAVICLTGAVIWWPGMPSWRQSLTIDWRANWKRMNWTLHSAIGFWGFIVVFGFAFTGFYLVFQEPFMAMVNYFEPIEQLSERRQMRTGDLILRWFARLHFGRFRGAYGWALQALWVVLGLIPPVLFATGALMWWNRVLAPAMRRLSRDRATGEAPASSRQR
jgi:uncharacterized iron-regulated membrane protein